METGAKKIRLDKWLWATRFYKTRALAAQAVTGGKVHLNGNRIKPSRTVKTGDCFEIQRGQERFEVVVKGLSERRASAVIALGLYQETESSIENREIENEKRKLAAMQRPRSESRPDKKQRRKIRQFKQRSEQS